MASTIIGILPDRAHAEEAIASLEAKDYNPKDFTIIMKDDNNRVTEQSGKAAGGAVGGATTGAVVGALAGLLVSAGILPGLGALFIGGPLAAALGLGGAAAVTTSAAATGALAGGILGLLGQLGLSAQDAHTYEKRIKEGGVVIAVPTQFGEENEVTTILHDHNAEQVRRIENAHDYMTA